MRKVWSEKLMHGKFPKFLKSEYIDLDQSFQWMKDDLECMGFQAKQGVLFEKDTIAVVSQDFSILAALKYLL